MILIKKTDKIVLFPFLRLFSLILVVTTFIILIQFMLVWFNELIGKDLGFWVYFQLLCFFGINATPLAFPLATLVSSLMVFGNLGEQLELTALKSAGIPFVQIVRPLFIFVGFLSLLAYISHGYLVPKVTIKAYTLLYDLRKTKPAVAIKEGVFYNGIPGYSIRVEKKLPDQKQMEGIIIYKHEKNQSNLNVTVAPKGRLSNLEQGKYLVIELFDGHTYIETIPEKRKTPTAEDPDPITIPNLYRTSFKTQRVLINLDDFKLNRTEESYFSYYHSTKNNIEIDATIDSLKMANQTEQKNLTDIFQQHYATPSTPNPPANSQPATDPTAYTDTERPATSVSKTFTQTTAPTDSLATHHKSVIKDLEHNPKRYQIIHKALQRAKKIRNASDALLTKVNDTNKELKRLRLERNQRAAYALGGLIMLLIGASLGALIKKGGLGMPLLISTIFILLYYVMDMFGTKWAKAELINTSLGAWASNITLLPFGLFFLLQAQRDTHLLDRDSYLMAMKKMVRYIFGKKSTTKPT